MSVSALDELLAEAKAEGIARGEIIGKARGEIIGEARGEIKGVKGTILNILNAKFKMPKVPKKIEAAIQRIDNLGTLDSLVVRAAVSQTFDEFVEVLK